MAARTGDPRPRRRRSLRLRKLASVSSAIPRRLTLRVMSSVRVLWWNVDWQSAAKIDQQIAAVLGLSPRPDVVGLCEVDARRARWWRRALRAAGYEFARTAPGLA